jgi:hypothetical protein
VELIFCRKVQAGSLTVDRGPDSEPDLAAPDDQLARQKVAAIQLATIGREQVDFVLTVHAA